MLPWTGFSHLDIMEVRVGAAGQVRVWVESEHAREEDICL